MKILIVEDQADIRATLKDILEINGYDVLAAEDGEEGVKFAAQAPEFIFCDVQMPKLDGYGVLAAVKQMPGVCDVPFVFLTARADRTQHREGMTLGADDYITKPFSEREILDAIEARVKRHHKVREQVQQLTEQHRREINAHWSHELLTPLNAVIGSLDILEMDADTIDRAELKEMLALIREGAERQERLARKLICYFSLEQRLQSPAPGKRSSCHAERAIQAGIARADRKKNPDGPVSISAVPGLVGVDEEPLATAIAEVVSNALNFSPPGAPVLVTGTCHPGLYRIEITDQGPGLTAEQRVSVGAFTQFDRGRREQQGLGLGFAIARATSTLAGGHFTLEANGEKSGLKTVFSLPIVANEN